MTSLVDRDSEDQPWVVAGSVVVAGTSRDRVFVGNNDFAQPGGRTATVDLSANAATAAAPAGFAPHQIERRVTVGQDGPPVRLALHRDGTVYAAFQRWVTASGPNVTLDVVVTRDDNWGAGANPFSALVDPGDGTAGKRVATGRFVRFNATMGQERLGADLAIAVDPASSKIVWLAWCDRVGGASGTDWTVHVRRSTDRGATWSADVRTITNAKNPALAISSTGTVGLAYQQFTASRWVTQLELTPNAWATPATRLVLHTAPAGTPAAAVPSLPRRLHPAALGGHGPLRRLLGQQHPGHGELPERGHLPARRRLGHPEASRHGRGHPRRAVDRPVLLPLGAVGRGHRVRSRRAGTMWPRGPLRGSGRRPSSPGN